MVVKLIGGTLPLRLQAACLKKEPGAFCHPCCFGRAFGVTLFELLNGKLPYHHRQDGTVKYTESDR